jgi:hypothetical protein
MKAAPITGSLDLGTMDSPRISGKCRPYRVKLSYTRDFP